MKMKQTLLAAGAIAASSVLFGSAIAHESRVLPASVNNIRLTIGFHAEPAFEDAYNGLDVILYSYDGACADPTDFWGNPIDTRGTAGNADPDTVSLTADALYLKNQTPPTGPNGSVAPAGILKTLAITNASPLKASFSDPGTYTSYFRPTNPGGTASGGAYGFHIKGTVHAGPSTYKCEGEASDHALAARTATIDAYFICGAGTFSPGHSFNCIEAIQSFPGKASDGYEPSKAYGSGGHR
jgi:hypothetical protein